jgi:hypothetical protein
MWMGPKLLIQFYHIHFSILIAWYLNNLTTIWFGWLILIILSVWDLCAVLPKYFQKSNYEHKIPIKNSNNNNNNNNNYNCSHNEYNDEVKGINSNMQMDEECDINYEIEQNNPELGTGDFVFYSLLIAKSITQFNSSTIIGCFLSIIIGLLITILLVAYLKRPLPALPLSIFLAVSMFFGNEYPVVPFSNRLNILQIFI